MATYAKGKLLETRMFVVAFLIVLGTLSVGTVGALACPSNPGGGHHSHGTPPPPPPPPAPGL